MEPDFLQQIHARSTRSTLLQYVQNRRKEQAKGETILDELRSKGVPTERAIDAIKGNENPNKPSPLRFLKLGLALTLMIAATAGIVLAFVNDIGDHKKLARTLFWLSIPATAGTIMLVDVLAKQGAQNQAVSEDFEEPK